MLPALSRREREVLDVLHRLGRATAAEVRDALASPPSDSAVRTHLRILEDKGHATHASDGTRYVYRPVVETAQAGRGALRHAVATFFSGAPDRAFAALLDEAASDLSDADLDRLSALVEEARRQGR